MAFSRASLALLLLATFALSAGKQEYGSPYSPTFQKTMLRGTEIFKSKDNTEDIRLRKESHARDNDNVLYFSFDDEIPDLLRDETGHYKVRQASYIRTASARVGQAAALFNRRENRILVDSPPELWPGQGPLRDFTIEMWIKPQHFFNHNVLLKREMISSAMQYGQKKSIEIVIKNNYLMALCPNLFFAGDRPLDIKLASRFQIPLRKWTHIAFSYSVAARKLTLRINGLEEIAYRLPEEHSAEVAGIDRSPIVIGENYSGIMDELRISSSATNNARYSDYSRLELEQDRPVHGEGEAISQVQNLPETAVAERARITYQAHVPEGTVLQFFFRSSLSPFQNETAPALLPWKSMRREATRVDPFRYYQWKAVLRPDARGQKSPVLKGVSLAYEPLRAPDQVQNARVVPGFSTDEQVCLEWSLLPEGQHSIYYIIYYGYSPDVMAGRLAYMNVNGKKEKIRRWPEQSLALNDHDRKYLERNTDRKASYLQNKMRLIITNPLIAMNQAHHPMRPLPMLYNGRVVYFRISAEIVEPVRLESQQSRMVHGRLERESDLK